MKSIVAMNYEVNPSLMANVLKLAIFIVIAFIIFMIFIIYYGRRLVKSIIELMKGKPYWRDQGSVYSKQWLIYGVFLYGISSLTCESSFADLMAIQCGFVALVFQIVSLISSLDAPSAETHERAD